MKDKGLSILLKVKGFTARKCRNCGRETVRTEDWACQWCGYSLLSKSCKEIPKTYRELKEERGHDHKSSEVEAGTAIEPEPVFECKLEQVPELEPATVMQPKPESVVTAIEVTVDELFSAYATDEELTDKRFGNKMLKVTGIVSRTRIADFLEYHYINLTNTENSLLEHLRCFFDKKHGPELSRLITGQEVTVQGRYDGSIVNICLRDCVLVS